MKISLGVYESFSFHQLKGEPAARDGGKPEGVLSPENSSESSAGSTRRPWPSTEDSAHAN